MPNAYPWSVEKSFRAQMRVRKTARDISVAFMVLSGLVLSPLSFVAFLVAVVGFRTSNNNWRVRGRIMMAMAILLALLFYGLLRLNPITGITEFLYSFGDKRQGDGSFPLIEYLIYGFPISLFFAGLAAYFANGYFELLGRRYLDNSQPSFVDKLRIKKNSKKFKDDDLNDSKLEVGVVIDDLLPWRQNRRGMIVGTDFDRVKHGYVIGANGTGKTITEMNMAAEYSAAGWSIVFPDFKGDKKTENMLAAIAKERGVPFYSFWSNSTDTGLHYDPLTGVTDISPASIIITAFDFATEGPAAFYTDQCEKYLALQFAALDYLEKNADESTFDWLLKTCDPKVLANLLTPVAGSKDGEVRNHVKRLIIEIKQVDRKYLSRLEANLSKVINTVGVRMRPGENMINFRKTSEQQAIVYFGLPSSGDKTVMRALGSLIIRDLVSFASERQGIENANVGTPVLIMPDEASQLQEKADTMLELLQQGRSARMMLFPAMQTFSSFSEKFIRELLGNSPTSIVFRVSDEVTTARLTETFRDMYVRQERRDSTTSTDFLGSEQQTFSSGSAGTIQSGPRISKGDIGDLENQTALVHFPESSRQATVKKPHKGRVKNPVEYTDIPTTLMVSRDYILEAENDYNLPREMLAKTLGAPIVASTVELDSFDLDNEFYEAPSEEPENESFDDDVVETVNSVEEPVVESDDTDEWGNPVDESEINSSGSVEGFSENVQEYQEELSDPDDTSVKKVDKEEGHW